MHHVGTKQLETERLLLRRYRMSDAGDMFKNWVTDREVTRFGGWEPHKDIAVTRSLLKQWIQEYEKSDCYHWVIVCKSSSQAIGYIYLDSVNPSDSSAAVHYLLSREYWNRGIMSEACRRVIEFAFCDVGFHRIDSCYHCDNPASGQSDAKMRDDIYPERIPYNGRRPTQWRIPLVFDLKQIAFPRSDRFIGFPKHRTVNALLIVLCFFLFSGDLFSFRHFCPVPCRIGRERPCFQSSPNLFRRHMIKGT